MIANRVVFVAIPTPRDNTRTAVKPGLTRSTRKASLRSCSIFYRFSCSSRTHDGPPALTGRLKDASKPVSVIQRRPRHTGAASADVYAMSVYHYRRQGGTVDCSKRYNRACAGPKSRTTISQVVAKDLGTALALLATGCLTPL